MPQGQSYPTTFLRSDNSYQDPFTNNLTTNNPSYPYASLLAAWLAAAGLSSRKYLTAPTTLYVATNGSDVTGDGSLAKPFQTPQHLMNVFAAAYDAGGQTVTLQAVAGHANFTSNLVVTPWVGGGTLIFDGGGGSITYTGVNPNDGCIVVGGIAGGIISGTFVYQNVTTNMTQGAATSTCFHVGALGGVLVQMGPGYHIGASSGVYWQLFSWSGAWHQLLNSFDVASGALALLGAFRAELNTMGTPVAVKWLGNVTYSQAIVWAQDPSKIFIASATFNPNGHTIAGSRYLATLAGVIEGVGQLNSIGTSNGTTPNGGFVN
jgi:hypothetical protein